MLLCLMGRNATSPPQPGERFGRWTVTGEPTWYDDTHRAVPCRCDCGTERTVLVQALRRKDRDCPSCGCWRREQSSAQAKQQWTTHGRAAHGHSDPLYRLWLRIKKRCHDPKAHNYRWYGARGISVWEPWRHDAGAFITYIEQNLGPRPEGMSLDRRNNDGNYEPGNLRWATQLEQVRNRRPRSSS